MSSTASASNEQDITFDDDLPKLTSNQQAFISHVMRGFNYTDAYKQSYNCSGKHITTIYQEVQRLTNNRLIVLWLSRLQEEGAILNACTYANSLNRLHVLSKAAEGAGQYSAAVKAEESRGKLAGLYVERVESVGEAKAEEALKALIQHLGRDAGLAMARSLGMVISTEKPIIEHNSDK